MHVKKTFFLILIITSQSNLWGQNINSKSKTITPKIDLAILPLFEYDGFEFRPSVELNKNKNNSLIFLGEYGKYKDDSESSNVKYGKSYFYVFGSEYRFYLNNRESYPRGLYLSSELRYRYGILKREIWDTPVPFKKYLKESKSHSIILGISGGYQILFIERIVIDLKLTPRLTFSKTKTDYEVIEPKDYKPVESGGSNDIFWTEIRLKLGYKININ